MPPRKSLRLAAGTAPDGTADLTVAQPRSAAQEAWAISEIRSAVFRELDKPDLARCLRVEKGTMRDVARELYHTVDYKFARKMSAATARQRLYCQSVHTINCRDMVLPPSMFREVDAILPPVPGCTTAASRAEHHTKFYSVPLIETVIPPIRKKFRNTRMMLFGGEYASIWTDSWVVRFAPESGRSAAGTIGQIDLAVGLRFTGWSKPAPPPAMGPAPLAPEGYTLCRRFDMEITSMEGPATDQWLAAFREKPYFSDLSSSIHLSRFPYHLNDVVCLCNRQAESGGRRGLSRVEAEDILPFDIYDLRTFATASSSLTELVLLPSRSQVDHLALAFDDLPEIISTIRSGFPFLLKLGIALKGVETAEETVLPLLSSRALEPGGLITQLYVGTATTSDPLFNLIRYFSQMCSSEATIDIGYGRTEYVRKGRQTTCLRYLRKQSASQRSHLSTIDFSSLNITTLDEISALQYHDGGRPRGLAESKALGVVEILKATGPPVAEKYRGWLDATFEQSAQSSRLMEMVSTSTDSADKLLAAEKALQAVQCIRGMGMLLQDLFSEGDEGEIKKYIESLKRDVEGP